MLPFVLRHGKSLIFTPSHRAPARHIDYPIFFAATVLGVGITQRIAKARASPAPFKNSENTWTIFFEVSLKDLIVAQKVPHHAVICITSL